MLGLGLSPLLKLLSPSNVPTDRDSGLASPGVVMVSGSDRDANDFFSPLQDTLEKSPDIKVVDRRLLQELPKEDRQTLPQKLKIARQYRAKLLVDGQSGSTSGTREDGKSYAGRWVEVVILEVDTGAILWRRQGSSIDGGNEVEVVLDLVVKEIKKRMR